MIKEKCTKCGLTNLPSDLACRRCCNPVGDNFMHSSPRIGPRQAAKSGSWLSTLVLVALLGGAAWYLFSGVEKSYDSVKTTEQPRSGPQANKPADTPATRTQFEQQQKQNYKTAVANSEGLRLSQKHTDETQKLMQSIER
jgi:hypothetical protein